MGKMGKENSPVRDLEQRVEAYLHSHYKPNRAWVKENLETLQDFRGRNDFSSDREIISWAIETTKNFAVGSGINNHDRISDTGVLHIPSRLAAIRRFESATHTLMKQLSQDKMIQIYIIAETTNLRRSIQFASSDKAFTDLENLTNLLKLHKEIINP